MPQYGPDGPGLVGLEDGAEAKTGARRGRRCCSATDEDPRGLPLTLSPEARAHGWIDLLRAQQVGRTTQEAIELQDGFFAGESFIRLMVTPLCGTASLFLLYLAFREKFGGQSKHEERHGHRTKGPELMFAFRWNRSAKANGIRLRLKRKFSVFARRPRQEAEAAPVAEQGPVLPLFAETAPTEFMQPELRKSAFKKKEGTAREWKTSGLGRSLALQAPAILVYRRRFMLAIRLPADVESRLDRLAQRTGRSKTFYAREAILEHLDDMEDLYLAEQQMTEIRAGQLKAIPLEEVMKRYGMEG